MGIRSAPHRPRRNPVSTGAVIAIVAAVIIVLVIVAVAVDQFMRRKTAR